MYHVEKLKYVSLSSLPTLKRINYHLVDVQKEKVMNTNAMLHQIYIHEMLDPL